MKTTLSLILALALTAFAAAAAPVDEEIRAAEKAWADAIKSADQAALGRLLADQLIYGHSSGVIDTKTDYLTKLRSGDQKYTHIEFKNMTIKSYGESAVVHGHIRMAGATKGQPFDNQLMVMHVWVKQGGRWQLAGHQTARLP
jgi:ketosteroid isomerase-like protein